MKINMEKGRLVIEFDGDSNKTDLLVKGALQASYFLDQPEGPEDFTNGLRQANAARNACRILDEIPHCMKRLDSAKTRGSFASGLNLGLAGEFREISGTRVYPDPPRGSVDIKTFEYGWQLGFFLRRAVDIANGNTK